MLGLRIGRILVAEQQKPHRIAELASRVKVNRGSAHRVLTQFAANKWVTRQENETRAMYAMTEAGVRALVAALSPFQIIPLGTDATAST